MKKILFFIVFIVFAYGESDYDKNVKKCNAGDGYSCLLLGTSHYHMNKYKQAEKWYKKGCENNNIDSCLELAHMYEEGIGIRKNINKAKQYFKKGCNTASQFGCHDYRRLGGK